MEAIKQIHEALLKSGYSEDQANSLLARFLQEEAADYLYYMMEAKKDLKDDHKHKKKRTN